MTFDFIKSPSAAAVNRAAAESRADWLIITDENFETDCEIMGILESFISEKNAVAVTFRITPDDSGANYDPATLKTGYIKERAFAADREIFLAVGGFDEMLSEKGCFELSARLKTRGDIYYCPFAVAKRLNPPDEKQKYIKGLADDIFLAYKYGSKEDAARAKKAFQNAVKNPIHFESVRKDLVKEYRAHFGKVSHFSKFRRQNPDLFSKTDLRLSPFEAADRGVYPADETDFAPLISVVIRTHERKEILRRTLTCLRNQIYKNFQIVVAEDGKNTAEQMIKTDFADLNIKYFATGGNVGRGRAGNLGIEKADGEYIAFLDDDDYYYADFLSAFVSFFSKNPGCDLAICSGMRYETDILSREPYEFTVGKTYPIRFDRINLMDMCVKCRIPMPCAVFKKELYEKLGGMHENIGGDEDWFMWLKFLKIRKRASKNAPDIPRALSLFGYPADREKRAQREKVYAEYDKIMLSDDSLVFTVTADEIKEWENAVKADALHLKNIGAAQSFMSSLNPMGCKAIKYADGETLTLTAMQINKYYYRLMSEYLK
ncbi:MAG: glycosyltransferase [Oscillospiraceae bacterium]|nr:glycosyltransferase [Oscillospiraceae bacterium]